MRFPVQERSGDRIFLWL